MVWVGNIELGWTGVLVVFVEHVKVADDVGRVVWDSECFSKESFGFVGREIVRVVLW